MARRNTTTEVVTTDSPTGQFYTWPCWWGGECTSATPPLIAQKRIALRRRVGGLQAVREPNGPTYAVKKASTLYAKLRAAEDEEDCGHSISALDVVNIPVPEGTLALVSAEVRLEAPDGSFITGWGCGHGASVPQGEKRRGADDKAAGKGITYAEKRALISLLCLPDAELDDADDEESPVGQLPPVTVHQVRAALESARTAPDLKAAVALAAGLSQAEQQELQPVYFAAKQRLTE